MAFRERKAKAMAQLASNQIDRSRKGGLDAPIEQLVRRVNSHPDFFTTSSCSGRITLFLEQHFDDPKKRTRKGGDWMLISHDLVESEDVVRAAREFVEQARDELLVFRFEPFILAVDCASVSAAQELVTCAVGSGFRESGITSVRKRIMVAIRCSIRLEVPVAKKGNLLVSEDYLRFLSSEANQKMNQNRGRCDRFLSSFITKFQRELGSPPSGLLIEVSNNDYFKVEENEDLAAVDYHDICKSDLSSDLDNTVMVASDILEDGLLQKLPGPAEENRDQNNGCSRTTTRWFDDAKGEHLTLQTSELLLDPPSTALLQRWGHSSCTVGKSVLVIGGYGGVGRHSRLNDVLLLSTQDCALRTLDCSGGFSSRMAHTVSVVNDTIWVVAGRKAPHVLLGEVLTIDAEGRLVHAPKASGDLFIPRHRHAAAVVSNTIYVFGGLGESDVLGDLFALNINSLRWSLLKCEGDIPCARHSHTLTAIGHKLYLFGGYDGKLICGGLYVLDTATRIWTKVAAGGEAPVPRFSHSCTAVGNYLAVLGGCPTMKQANTVFFLDTLTMQWNQVHIALPGRSLLTRHTANLVGDLLVVLGGGASCYAFGTTFSTSFIVDLRACIRELDQWSETLRGAIAAKVEGKEWALQVDRTVAKTVKDALKRLGWLDPGRRSQVISKVLVAFPVTVQAANQLETRCACRTGAVPCPHEVLARTGGTLVSLELPSTSHLFTSPLSKLEKEVALLLQRQGLPLSLLGEIPKRWGRLGDLGILPASSMVDEAWAAFGSSIWEVIANALGVVRLARQGPVAATGTRDSGLTLLLGDDGWVKHRENGILYCFDATKCMFSSGNVTERSRMGQLNCEQEVVVDLFAGIGYFVLPFLIRAHARRVYACEWNPCALDALRRNLSINKVDDRCTIIEGDNRVKAPQGVANRVCLGLLPSSEGSWHVAVKALRPEGGVLHVHENVSDTGEDTFIDYLVGKVRELAAREGRRWTVNVAHLEHVKWYAPHVRHIVVDVNCENIAS